MAYRERAEKHEKDFAESQGRIRELETLVAECQTRLEDVRRDVERLAPDKDGEIAKLREELASQEAINCDLRASLSKANDIVKELTEELEFNENELNTTKDQNKSLRKQTDADIKESQRQLRACIAREAELKGEIEVHKKNAKQNQSQLTRDLEDCATAAERALKLQLAGLQEKLKSTEDAEAQRSAEVTTLKATEKELRASLDAENRDREWLSGEVQSLHATNTTLRAKLSMDRQAPNTGPRHIRLLHHRQATSAFCPTEPTAASKGMFMLNRPPGREKKRRQEAEKLLKPEPKRFKKLSPVVVDLEEDLAREEKMATASLVVRLQVPAGSLGRTAQDANAIVVSD